MKPLMLRRCSQPTARHARWSTRLRMRTLLVVVVLLPVLGMGGFAASSGVERWRDREASAALARDAAALDQVVALRAAVSHEQVHTFVRALASEVGYAELQADVTREELDSVRETVDEALRGQPAAVAEDVRTTLAAVRRDVDRGTATWASTNAAFVQLDVVIGARWDDHVAAIERTADTRPIDSVLRARLRAVRDSATSFPLGSARMRHSTAVRAATAIVPTDDAAALVRADAAYAQAVDGTEDELGPEGFAAWRRFRDHPAAQRTEARIAGSVEIALGAPATTPTPAEYVRAVSDSAIWGMLLIDITSAASHDLAAAASAAMEADTRSVLWWSAAALVGALASVAVGAVIARRLAQPARDLEEAARRIAEGQFDLPDLRIDGSREVAAIVTAFNDMAGTLAAVEEHAVALADDPDAPVLDQPLPGPTGRALQVAIDRLRSSIALAERRRVELVEIATRDGLTNLLNRAATFEAIDRSLAASTRVGRPLLALFVDLDGLKALNDAHGHAAGDDALRRIARALDSTTRRADVLGRIGGDEFLLVGPVPEGGREGAEALAFRVLDALRAARFHLPDGSLTVIRCSVGLAFSEPDDDANQLVASADAALYRAKHAGRDRAAWAEPDLQPT